MKRLVVGGGGEGVGGVELPARVKTLGKMKLPVSILTQSFPPKPFGFRGMDRNLNRLHRINRRWVLMTILLQHKK